MPVEGETSVCEIPDLQGETATTVKALREGKDVTVSVEGPLTGASIEIILEDGSRVSAVLEGKETKVAL